MSDKKEYYLNYIANHYDEIVNCVDLGSIKNFNHTYDEDILHDTILKCLNTIENLNLSDNQIKNYIFISYNTNYKRELDYARNKNRDDVIINDLDVINNDSNDLDYNTIKNIIKEKFGDREWNLFEEFIYGDSITNISKENNESGLYYRFNKIKNYAKQFIKK